MHTHEDAAEALLAGEYLIFIRDRELVIGTSDRDDLDERVSARLAR